MTLTQAADFLAESEALFEIVAPLDAAGFQQVTQFKGWTINDVIVHLHFWNSLVDLSLNDEVAFLDLAQQMAPVLMQGGFRAFEDPKVEERGPALALAWINRVREMTPRWSKVDPKKRLPWVGPSMSARSAMTARQMETWAHGFEVFDRLGAQRVELDRIKNIVVLGVNTFGWSHKVHGLDVPDAMPELVLTAPSGEVWTWGEPDAGQIAGPAVDFVAVVTQTRAFVDTALTAMGEIAQTWMAHAQCFAGAPIAPPAAGTRGIVKPK